MILKLMKSLLTNFSGIAYFLILLTNTLCAQPIKQVELRYISPTTGSKYIMPENNIAFRYGEILDTGTVRSSMVSVKNNKGEEIDGTLVFSDDKRTLIFLPNEPYALGSRVNVSLQPGLRTISGKSIRPVEFCFYVTNQKPTINEHTISNYFENDLLIPQKPQNNSSSFPQSTNENNYPEGYAFGNVLFNNNPYEGYYFYCPNNEWSWYPETLPFASIIDKHGIPVFYRKFDDKVYDLKPQPGGYLSCYSFNPIWGNILMDSSFQFLDTCTMGNGYSYTDFHEFQVLENGHYFVMTFDAQIIDMSLVVPGGHPEAIVQGFVFQEIDTNENVVFQWRSWDHYEITETGPQVDLTAEHVDYVHGNTIDVESDTSLLISSRNFNEITKIDRNSGEIIWRLGGSQNQFEFINDTLGFSSQHDCRRNSEGHLTLYDNGKFHPSPKFSSALEYDLDPANMTATLINRYRHDPDIFGMAMGNSFWTPQESIVVGWGTALHGITEFDDDGSALFELEFNAMNYRAYRHPWKTNRFYPEKDSLHFGSLWVEDSLAVSLKVYNNKDEILNLTSYHCHTENFIIENEFPITIQSLDSTIIDITFIPDEVGIYEDIITFNSDINTPELVQRIARQVNVTGYATEGEGIWDNTFEGFSIYPNPIDDMLIIKNKLAENSFSVEIFNGKGVLQYSSDHIKKNEITINAGSWHSGLYLIKIQQNGEKTSNFKVIKN